MRQAYDYWQDQPGNSPRQTRASARRTYAGPESAKQVHWASQCKLKLVALGLPDNKQFSYPYKYNRSETRVLFTRRVKPAQKQYVNGRLQPKNPFQGQSPTDAVKYLSSVSVVCCGRCITQPGKLSLERLRAPNDNTQLTTTHRA